MTEAAPPTAESVVLGQFAAWLGEIKVLRKDVSDGFPSATAGPSAFADHLLAARSALDRAEELYGWALTIRAGARRAATACQHEADDAFDSEDKAQRNRRSREDFMTGREREADVRLVIFEKLREARRLARISDECSEMFERIKIVYDGLKDTRQDLLRMVGQAAWESHLER